MNTPADSASGDPAHADVAARRRAVENALTRLGLTEMVFHWKSGEGVLPLDDLERIVDQLTARFDSEPRGHEGGKVR